MAKFEEIFDIRPGHTLKHVGGHLGNYNDDWRHEERDEDGQVVAIYESWCHMPPRQAHSAGWRKFTPDRVLVEEHSELPL